MPTDSDNNVVVYFYRKPIWPLAEIPTIELEPKKNQDDVYVIIPQSESVNLSFRAKRMSRKRLVKRLMANGKSRNTANAIARTFGGHYANKYIYYVFTGRVILQKIGITKAAPR